MYGNLNAHTPHLDWMAANGVLFENWTSNNPVCMPSRVTAFTGQYPSTHGTLRNHSAGKIDSLDDTMLQYFKDQGYTLGWIGKNHNYDDKVFEEGVDYYQERGRELFRKYPRCIPPLPG